MADISAIFGILLLLGILFPGMLTAYWLLFPSPVERARARLESAPWSTFWVGLGITIALVIPIIILVALPYGPAKFLGFSFMVIVLCISGLGAAGIVARMADRLSEHSGALSPFSAFLRGAVTLELAAFFPLIGWFIIIPLAIFVSIGATFFALLRWSPHEKKQSVAPISSSSQA